MFSKLNCFKRQMKIVSIFKSISRRTEKLCNANYQLQCNHR